MTRQEQGRRPCLGTKVEGVGEKASAKLAKEDKMKEAAESKAHCSLPIKISNASPHHTPEKKKPKVKEIEKPTKATQLDERTTEEENVKAKRKEEEIGGTREKEPKEEKGKRRKKNRAAEDERDREEKSSSGSDEVEEEEDVTDDNAEERASIGSGLFFLKRHRKKAKAKQQERDHKVREQRQQLINLKRLVDNDASLQAAGPGAEVDVDSRNVEFSSTSKRAMKQKEDRGDNDQEGDGFAKERRKNNLGSFGNGTLAWVPPSGRSRRAMTDSELVITERPDVDVPDRGTQQQQQQRRKLSLSKAHAASAACVPGRKEGKAAGKKEKERKGKLRILSRSAPAGASAVARSLEDDEEEEDEDEEDEEEGEDEDDDEGDYDDDDDDDESACRFNGDVDSSPQSSPAFEDRTASPGDSEDEEFVPRMAFLDVVLMEAKDLVVLNKRAMRKLFKYKLFSPCFTVSVGENTIRTKRTTITDPAYHDHLTFTYQDRDDDATLSVKLFYRCRSKSHRSRRLHVGSIELPLSRVAAGQTRDLWLPIVPTCDYQLLWNWQHLGDDASNDARDARVAVKSKDRSRLRLGSVRMQIHKALDQSVGALSGLGLPSLAVPLRLKVGDVILFHCSQLASHGAKLATRSRWDHVAMVAKHRRREGLYLFEATRDGVHLFHLDRRLAFYLESRTELGVRRLRTERTNEMEEALHLFVAEVEGRPYKTNPLELLRALRDSNESDNLDTIFCSQLVAAAYQRMGILSPELCSNNYLPADFASDKIGDHLIGAELEEVVVVPPVRQKGSLSSGEMAFAGGSAAGSAAGSAPGSFQIGSFPF